MSISQQPRCETSVFGEQRWACFVVLAGIHAYAWTLPLTLSKVREENAKAMRRAHEQALAQGEAPTGPVPDVPQHTSTTWASTCTWS